MSHVCFMDETGTDCSSTHYSIGALLVDSRNSKDFQSFILHAKEQYRFNQEIKWAKTHKGYNLINLGLKIMHRVLTDDRLSFHCITVDKESYIKWSAANREEAFYITLTQLITCAAQSIGDNLEVKCDQRNDHYDKHHEVCQIISNYKLQSKYPNRVQSIEAQNSKFCEGIQVVDYLIGAINTSHRFYRNKNININDGKLCAIRRMSHILGWDDLAWDTWKNTKFNIWAFPTEYRAHRGESKKLITEIINSPNYLKNRNDIESPL
ncbi:DUF3800 domain-containing protein [Legionella saoudiensis]|uniref:DUF3800 domain-containing protein n=1 Tax=Legionella saoudiensis TaxID=1750561 RepID=UPI000731C8E8|nr:DUF3800 domain-containing protein [Legionella saoudiensis]